MAHIGASIGSRKPRWSYAVDRYRVYPENFPPGLDTWQTSEEENTRLAYPEYLKKLSHCVKGVNENLARLIQCLRENELLDNTVILDTSDQAFGLGECDFQDKQQAYVPSQRMPLLVRYPPAIPAEATSEAIIKMIDFPAKMLDFAGVQVGDRMQGRSFRSIGEPTQLPSDWKQAAYY